MKHLFFAAAALALSAPAFSAPALAQSASPIPTIAAGNALLSVSAEGRTTRKPDLALFTAGVASTGQTAGDALSANAERMSRVVAALRRAGIAERDIQTSNLSLDPVYADLSRQPGDAANQPQEPRIVGYRASNTVSVRQRAVEQYGKVIDTLVASGANQIGGPAFQMDDADAALDESRVDAVRRARARAELYARAAGLRVLRIVSISEGGGYEPRPMVAFARAEAAPSSPVAAGELALTTNVAVTFELAPR